MIAEQRQENEMRDQLEIYKKLRQSHQKEVLILESRLQAEMNEHRRTLDKEYDSQVHGQGSIKVKSHPVVWDKLILHSGKYLPRLT